MADEQQSPGPDPESEAGQEFPSEGQPSQEELRQRLEEQLRKVRVQDVLLESVASILNLSARRIAKQDEQDLEQARVGIDAVRAVVDLLEPEPREQVRSALSELQMLYAREAGGEGGPPPEGSGGEPGAGGPESPPPQRDSGLWTPPGSA